MAEELSESAATEARVDALVAKFEAMDAADTTPTDDDDEDGAGEGDGEDGREDADEESNVDSDDTDEDTDDQADGADAESDEDTEEDDDTDTDGDADESDDDTDDDDEADAEDADENENEDEDDATDETKAALARNGADLKLEDIPEQFRSIVEKKLKSIDKAYTRAAQEATAFRTREREIRAEEQYRSTNPDLVVVDLLRKGGPELFAKVNKLLNRIDPEADGNDADSVKDAEVLLDEKINIHRRKAAEAIEAVEKENAQINQRADQLEVTAREFAKKLGVPFGKTIEKLLTAAILEKPEAKRAEGLSDAEIRAIVKEHADEHLRSVRAHRREESKSSVKQRTTERKSAKPTVKAPKSASSPGNARREKIKVDHNDPDSRLAAMMRTARRVMPGTK